MKKNKVVKKPYVAPVYRKFNKGGKALKNLMKKYGAGGSVSDFGAQGNFTTKYTSNQPDVEELEDPNLILADVEELEDPNLILEENIIDAEAETEGQVPIAPMAEAENKVERAFSGAAKGVTVGSLLGPLGSLVGGAIGGVAGFLKGKKEKRRKRRQEGIKASFNEGGQVPEKEPDVKDLLHQLNRFGKKPRGLRGSWNMPPDEERQIPRHNDIYKYLASRGIDTKDDEIAKAYIMPGSVAGAGFVDGYDASAYSEKGRYLDPTKPSKPDLMNAGEFGAPPFPNTKGQRIMLASTQLKNPTTRIEEAVHSLQQQRFLDPSVSDSKIGGNKRRLYQMLKKQPWLKELSPDMEKTLTKGNYALKGPGSTSEFEAKLIASKMTMIQDGVLPEDGKVSDKDLEVIKQWYENYQNKTGETLWESVLFQDFSDKKYRDEILSTLNKL